MFKTSYTIIKLEVYGGEVGIRIPVSSWWYSVMAALADSRDRCLNLDISENRDQDKDLGAGSLFGSHPRKQELGRRECEAGVLFQGV